MNLSEMNPKSMTSKMNKVMQSRFGFAINYSELTYEQAARLNNSITESITRIQNSFNSHTAEKNPKYMELLMIREGLRRWIGENRNLMESEMGKSEAVLAAKDMVDSIQDMVEKISKMKAEQLPALIDTIRDQIGMQDADQFKNNISQVLNDLEGNLQQARDSADLAARQLSGEQVADQNIMGGEEEMEMPSEQPEESPEEDSFGMSPAAVGGTSKLGREQR